MEEKKVVMDINSLTASEGWKHIVEMIDHEIQANMEAICAINPENDKPQYSKNDILRSELQYLKFFKNTPQAVRDKYDSLIKTGSPM